MGAAYPLHPVSASPLATATTTVTSQPHSTNSAVSGGTIAAIILGVLAGLALTTIGILLVLLRRAHKRPLSAHSQREHRISALQAQSRTIPEADSRAFPHELPGDYVRRRGPPELPVEPNFNDASIRRSHSGQIPTGKG